MTVNALFALDASEPEPLRPPPTRTPLIVFLVALAHVGALGASALAPREAPAEPHFMRTKVMEWHAVDDGEATAWRTDGSWRPAIVRVAPRGFER
jgi:hypothetical protein